MSSDNGTEPTIVAAVDGSGTALQAVRWAAAEAGVRRWGLRILLSSASAPRTGLSAMEIVGGREWLYWNGEGVLSEAAAMARHVADGVEVTTELTADPVIDTLVERSPRTPMIVVGSHGRGAVRRALLGSVSSAVTRQARCPVAVVHRESLFTVGEDARPVVVGVDEQGTAVGCAFEEAALRGVGLQAVRCCDDEVGGFVLDGELQQFRADETRALNRQLDPWHRKYPEVPLETEVMFGGPAQVLLERARDAQLLVVGRHRWTGLVGTAMRSTRAAVLHRAHCPTLVVPEHVEPE